VKIKTVACDGDWSNFKGALEVSVLSELTGCTYNRAMRIPFLAIVFLLVIGAFSSAAAQKCFEYGPTVSITGKLSSRVVPGPPNYSSIRKGDQKETMILLTLTEPICTTGNDPAGIDVPEEGIRELQLAISKDEDWPAIRRLIGKRATVSGTLFHAHTGHHRTKVLMDVSQVRAAS